MNISITLNFLYNTSRQNQTFYYQRHEYMGVKCYNPHSPNPKNFCHHKYSSRENRP